MKLSCSGLVSAAAFFADCRRHPVRVERFLTLIVWNGSGVAYVTSLDLSVNPDSNYGGTLLHCLFHSASRSQFFAFIR